MLELTLREQIQHFVREFKVVKEGQIVRFFKDYWGRDNVRYVITEMIQDSCIFRQPNGLVSALKKLPMTMTSYESILLALDVLCAVPSHRVRWFAMENFPQEIAFLTDEDLIYDITFFDQTNWVMKYPLIPRQRRSCLPDGMDDPVVHIAALCDESLIPKIEPLGFSRYAILAPGGWVKEMIGYEE